MFVGCREPTVADFWSELIVLDIFWSQSGPRGCGFWETPPRNRPEPLGTARNHPEPPRTSWTTNWTLAPLTFLEVKTISFSFDLLPVPPLTFPEVKNIQSIFVFSGACAFDLPWSQKHSINYFSLSLCCLVFLHEVVLLFFLLLLGGAAFLLLLWVGAAWVVSPVWWCCLPSPPLGSGEFPPSSVGWCCLVSAPFRWCCCFSFSCLVVLLSIPSFGLWCFFPLFSWVVLLDFLLLWVVLLFFCAPFCGVAFLLLLWVVLLSFPSSG